MILDSVFKPLRRLVGGDGPSDAGASSRPDAAQAAGEQSDLVDDLLALVGPLPSPAITARDEWPKIDQFIGALEPSQRIELLKLGVERLPEIRASKSSRSWSDGVVLYETVCKLYRSKKLKMTEDDLVEILMLAAHHCGHGEDTRPPFDLALRFQRTNGYSPALGSAIQHFASNLPNSRASKVRNLKSSAALLSVLEGSYTVERKRRRGSTTFEPVWPSGMAGRLRSGDGWSLR